MIRFYNIMYYNFVRLQQLFQTIIRMPFRFILNTKKVKNFYKNRGIENPEKTIFNAADILNTNVYFANIHIFTLFFLLICGSINYISGFLKYKFHFHLVHYILIGGVMLVMDYLFLSKDDKYLNYFKEFDKMSKKKKQKSAWLTFITVLSIWAFFIGVLTGSAPPFAAGLLSSTLILKTHIFIPNLICLNIFLKENTSDFLAKNKLNFEWN